MVEIKAKGLVLIEYRQGETSGGDDNVGDGVRGGESGLEFHLIKSWKAKSFRRR